MKHLLLLAGIIVVTLCTGCSPDIQLHQPAGAPNAPDLMIHYGCNTCHVIRDVPGAVGKVGPPLTNLSQRSYLAGTLENTPDQLVLWLEHPQRLRPGTAMPEMGVTTVEAAKMASFLEALK